MAPAERVLKRARRLGIATFGVVVAAFTAICSFQIIRDVWFAEAPPAESRCRAGLRDLMAAVEAGRHAASSERGERQALDVFRDTLRPAWRKHESLRAACRDDKRARAALSAIDRLRYAEEHAVRYEANDLTLRRQRVRALEQELGLGRARPQERSVEQK